MGTRQLVIQFQLGSGAVPDFDAVVRIEDYLIQAYAQNGAARVDGHDVGEGKVNFFIHPKDSWTRVIEIAQAHLKHRGLLDSAVLVKRLESDRWAVVWPPRHDGSFSL